MEDITITIPKKMLSGRTVGRHLIVVDPKEYERVLRRRWEEEEAIKASKAARKAWREGKTRLVSDLKELMK